MNRQSNIVPTNQPPRKPNASQLHWRRRFVLAIWGTVSFIFLIVCGWHSLQMVIELAVVDNFGSFVVLAFFTAASAWSLNDVMKRWGSDNDDETDPKDPPKGLGGGYVIH